MPATVLVGRFTPLVACGLRQALRGDTRVRVVATGIDTETLEESIAALEPQVTIVSDHVEISLMCRLAVAWPEVGLVVLAANTSPGLHQVLLVAGARCIVAQTASVDEILSAVQLAAGHGAAKLRATSGRALLTPREAEILTAMSHGLGNAEIAHSLGISIETVRTYVVRVMRKLGVSSRKALVVARDPTVDALNVDDN